MSPHYPILACGSIYIPTWEVVLIFALAAGWLAAAILYIVNLVMTFQVNRLPSFRRNHCLMIISYTGLAGLLFFCANNGGSAYIGIPLMIAVPLLVIGHFVYLLRSRRRFKREPMPDAVTQP